MSTQITIEVPLALQRLIRSNNTLLKNHQLQLMREIEEANVQMMGILKLSPEAGWVLDMERMVYTRPGEETTQPTDAPIAG